MNDYIKRLKENLSNYNAYMRGAKVYIENDRKNYIGEMLKEKELRYIQKKHTAYEKFRNQCVSDFSSIKKMISKASFINPDVLQSSVYKMFSDGNFELTRTEVEIYLTTAKENHDFTLLKAIKNYSDKHELGLHVDLAEDVVNGYKTFYEGALALANRIYAYDEYDFSSEVSAFADEDFCKPLYDTIGNCLYKNSNVNALACESAFDNVVLMLDGRAIGTEMSNAR